MVPVVKGWSRIGSSVYNLWIFRLQPPVERYRLFLAWPFTVTTRHLTIISGCINISFKCSPNCLSSVYTSIAISVWRDSCHYNVHLTRHANVMDLGSLKFQITFQLSCFDLCMWVWLDRVRVFTYFSDPNRAARRHKISGTIILTEQYLFLHRLESYIFVF